ncbi:MAG: phosphate ABC transporter substrate-binding/OmpA family protein [Elainellaceae cyanobacterium]
MITTLGLLGGGGWLLTRVTPGLVPSLSDVVETGVRSPQGTQQIKVLGDTFSGYSTFRNAAFQDALADVDIKLQYDDEFDQAKRAEQLSRGNADIIVTTLDQYLQHQPDGKIVGLIDRTIGADAVVLNSKVRPSLTSLLELNKLVEEARSQNRKVGMAFAGDTPSEYLALVLDTKFDDFNLNDFAVTRVADASEAWQLMQDSSKNVAIAIIWEPYVTQARQQGYTVVLSSQDAPRSIVDVVVASDQLLRSRPEVVSELLESYYRRIDVNVRDSSQLQAQIAEDGGLDAEDAAAVVDGIEFFTAAEAHDWLTDGTLERRIEATAAVLVLAGRLNDVPENMGELMTVEAIAPAAQNTETLIELVRADNPELAERLQGNQRAVTAAAPDLQAAAVQAAPDIGNLQVRGEVKFATGSAQLTGDSQQTLTQLSKEVAEFNVQTVAVRVIGHTSQTGSAAFNQSLSQQRAQVVANYLRSQGLQHNIVAEGQGFSQPLSGVDPGDPSNQRTEIRLVRVGGT